MIITAKVSLPLSVDENMKLSQLISYTTCVYSDIEDRPDDIYTIYVVIDADPIDDIEVYKISRVAVVRYLAYCYDYNTTMSNIYHSINNTIKAISYEEAVKLTKITPPTLDNKLTSRMLQLDEIDLTQPMLKIYCFNNPKKCIWEAFCESYKEYRDLADTLPSDSSIFVKHVNKTREKFLNSICRQRKNFLCCVKNVDGKRLETNNRLLVEDKLDESYEMLSKIFLNDVS